MAQDILLTGYLDLAELIAGPDEETFAALEV